MNVCSTEQPLPFSGHLPLFKETNQELHNIWNWHPRLEVKSLVDLFTVCISTLTLTNARNEQSFNRMLYYYNWKTNRYILSATALLHELHRPRLHTLPSVKFARHLQPRFSTAATATALSMKRFKTNLSIYFTFSSSISLRATAGIPRFLCLSNVDLVFHQNYVQWHNDNNLQHLLQAWSQKSTTELDSD